ncbi:3-(3-hydroxy-phenyl)propionate hydroxylase [Variovorax boronicumulans]|uniref:3-(3-hydroxy-phenyl)propionate hydroxylase n=1 Tax=Variovorax boronicumulans TaxID=436515 RepID=A0AAW8DUT8_9BURK|nr:FAD-dependent monooxygenase [Variovorax boronicumulans]MDP9878007.1 3-(3-hydroxy-phenyl)propionate hydroxylase [Variovorax boronicumulans]MDP9923290.1 3-(3-hydroxy-phenyl)propionate hydroxylase [Variovorax boronicumulans]
MDFVSYFDYEQHPPVMPATTNGRETHRHRVAVVGGGPIGLAVALGLARQGIASVVLEADDSVCLGSRAGCVTSRTLEILEQSGVADAVMRQGLPWAEGWSYYRTEEVLHLDVPQDAAARFPRLVNIQQCYIEQYMVEAARARYADLIEIRWQNRLEGLRQSQGGVELDLSTPEGRYTLSADWVVAADGAHSAVRKLLQLRFAGTRYEGQYIIADIKMKSALPPGRRAWFDPPSNPGATLLLHKHRDDLWRFDYQLREDEDPQEAVKPENVLQRIRSHLELMGEQAPWQPVWISLYRASCLTLEDYRHGRVLLAGDAAHLVPIFGVRGLNSGVEDANNLAWKLAYAIRGWGNERLLRSYTAERVFATRENMRHASKSAEFMAPPAPAFALMRSAVLGLAGRHPWVRRLIDPRQSTTVGYPQSPLNHPQPEGEDYAAGPASGFAFVDAPLPDGSHLCQHIGPHFTALAFDAPDAPALQRALSDSQVPIHVLSLPARGPLAERYDARAGTLYLFRPDGNLLARWRHADAAGIRAAVAQCCQGDAP